MKQQTSFANNTVVCHEAENAQSWDEFLSCRPEAHIEQTVAWGELKRIYGWMPTWVWAKRGSKILGGAMILTKRVGHFMAIGYVERGPVWDPTEPGSMELVTRALYNAASSLRITYLVIVLPYCGNMALSVLESMRFRLKPEPMPPTGVGRATLLIDLTQNIETLFADLSMSKRQNIRKAVRKGVRVRVGDGIDTDAVRDLMWAGCRRRGVSPSPPQLDFFDNLWRLMNPLGRVKFLLAEIDGQPVASGVALVYNGVMQLYRVGWSGIHADRYPNDLLHWEMIKWGHENLYHTFDFMHIRPEHARTLLRGERVEDSDSSGITEFKTGFGGQLRILPEIYYRSFNPLVNFGLNLGAARILDSPVYDNVLRKAFLKLQRATTAF